MNTVYTHNIVDGSTGELIQKEWIVRKARSTEHFVKLYLEDLGHIYQLPNSQYRLFCTLSEYLGYNTNEFFLNKERRQELAHKCNSTMATVNQNISRLVKKNLLIKRTSSMYQMNPLIFFNGEEMTRSKILEAHIRYEICDDC